MKRRSFAKLAAAIAAAPAAALAAMGVRNGASITVENGIPRRMDSNHALVGRIAIERKVNGVWEPQTLVTFYDADRGEVGSLRTRFNAVVWGGDGKPVEHVLREGEWRVIWKREIPSFTHVKALGGAPRRWNFDHRFNPVFSSDLSRALQAGGTLPAAAVEAIRRDRQDAGIARLRLGKIEAPVIHFGPDTDGKPAFTAINRDDLVVGYDAEMGFVAVASPMASGMAIRVHKDLLLTALGERAIFAITGGRQIGKTCTLLPAPSFS